MNGRDSQPGRLQVRGQTSQPILALTSIPFCRNSNMEGMRQRFEFRVVEEYASLLFSDTEGEHLGLARKITLDADDPRLPQVGKLQAELIATYDKQFFYGWRIERQYLPAELEAAILLHVDLMKWFEPAGEDSGTIYDEPADWQFEAVRFP
jgi:hypothetical protein